MERLRVMACDHLNLARGKYMAISKADSGVTRMSQGVFAVKYQLNSQLQTSLQFLK